VRWLDRGEPVRLAREDVADEGGEEVRERGAAPDPSWADAVQERARDAVRGGGGEEDRADTDVFAAVRSGEPAAAEGGAWPEEQSSAVATAEREDHGSPEAYSEEPAYSEEKTQKIAWPPKTETTEAIPTHETGEHTEEFPTEAERTEPTAKRDED